MKITKTLTFLILLVSITIFGTGCASTIGESLDKGIDYINPWASEKSETPDTLKVVPKSVSNDKFKVPKNPMHQVKDIIYYKKGINQDKIDNTPINNNNIITDISDEEDYDMLPLELRKNKIDYLDIVNKKLGNIVKLIMTQVKNTGLIIEPDVDLNRKINMTIKNRNIYEALKDLVEYSGYALKYDQNKKSIIISAYVQKRYYLPAGIFINRNADISFNSKSINPTFDANLKESVADLFINNLKKIGTKEKIVNFDRQSGTLYVKERALYMPEIDEYVTNFVKNRTQQFNVELAIIQISASKANQFGMDLQNIIADAGRISVNSLAGGFPLATSATATASTTSGVSYTPLTPVSNSSVARAQISLGNLSFDWLLGALDKRGYNNIITKPNVIVQNHQIGYISVLTTQSYIKEYKTTTTDQATITTPVLADFQSGLDFYVKIDKFPRKNFIQVAVVPNIKEATLTTYDSQNGPITIPKIQETSAFSTANIPSGNIIVLSGIKKKSKSGDLNSPLISKTPIIGSAFNSSTENDDYTEVVFLIKVTQIHNPRSTFGNASSTAKSIYRSF